MNQERILCLTGWQQEADALAGIVPSALHFEYDAYLETYDMLAHLPQETDVAIGWSLGGQLLARAVAGGYVRARRLVLLAPSFQCVADARFAFGLQAAEFLGISDAYAHDPGGMLAQFQALIGLGDDKGAMVTRVLARNKSLWKNGCYWLEELGRFSCFDLDFSGFPPTVLVHGENDKVTSPEHSRRFARAIGGAKVHWLNGCGHAPHLHDPAFIRDVIFDV